MEEYQERVIEERSVLGRKIDKLGEFLVVNAGNDAVSKFEKELMVLQRYVMMQYSALLEERIGCWGEE